ncbi:hypothetical protein ACTWPB_00220 [Nocardia sp. IBHARD005]|uniref:hypothetical protein n=1 Tax=Nocardia sp. IBHARD005 TaxID=3457765 RepID=UPI004059FC02
MGVRWGRAVVVSLVLAGLFGLGCYRLYVWRNAPSEARQLAEAASVERFTLAGVVDESRGDNPSAAVAFFIGPPPESGVLAAVAVPTIPSARIAVEPAAPDVTPSRTWVVLARGHRADGCGVSVVLDTKPLVRQSVLRSKNLADVLTAEQRAAVQSGSMLVVEVRVDGCGW